MGTCMAIGLIVGMHFVRATSGLIRVSGNFSHVLPPTGILSIMPREKYYLGELRESPGRILMQSSRL